MQSCRLIGITSPYSVSHIEKAIIATIKSNDIHSDMACRVTLFVEGDGTWSSDRPVTCLLLNSKTTKNFNQFLWKVCVHL